MKDKGTKLDVNGQAKIKWGQKKAIGFQNSHFIVLLFVFSLNFQNNACLMFTEVYQRLNDMSPFILLVNILENLKNQGKM